MFKGLKVKGEKCLDDVIDNTVHVMRIATGEIADTVATPVSEDKDPGAAGCKGGSVRP